MRAWHRLSRLLNFQPEFREERERFRAAQAGQRRIRSFRRDPAGYLQRLEFLWQGGDDP